MIKVLKLSPELAVIQIEVDLKMENARMFFEDFMDVLKDTPAETLIDFSQIRFVDSSGIGTLIKCAGQIKDKGGKLFLHGLNKSLSSVFKLSGLLTVFNVLDNDEARQKFPDLPGI